MKQFKRAVFEWLFGDVLASHVIESQIVLVARLELAEEKLKRMGNEMDEFASHDDVGSVEEDMKRLTRDLEGQIEECVPYDDFKDLEKEVDGKAEQDEVDDLQKAVAAMGQEVDMLEETSKACVNDLGAEIERLSNVLYRLTTSVDMAHEAALEMEAVREAKARKEA